MELTQLSPVTTVTFNYDYYYDDTCQYHQLQHMSTFLPILYTAVFLVGIIGNFILIVALVFKRRVQRVIDIFIINLAASDFIFLITLPFWVDKEASDGSWRVGSFLCKASSYVISVNMYCSILLLTCMSADRYLAIMQPSIARRVRTRSYSSGLCICVWLISCCLGMPTLLSRELKKQYGKTYCTDKAVTEAKQIMSLLLLILAFFLPLLSILTFYCSITRRLCVHYQRAGKHDKKLRKSIKIVFIVVAVFVTSWVPFNLFKLMAILLGLLKQPDCYPNRIAQLGMMVSSPFAFANSCANPFIYYCFDSYIRRAMLQCLCPRVKISSTGDNSDTLDTRLSHSLSTFAAGEYAARKRKRSVSL
ncbi:PREDICTED: G-protein coupled receptor 15 [Chaetura pelagica]|uniref:G-protein coupled receptor 15 n=1 Tax=Chaetura pelagica TaxID=8897 RepID=UPI000523E389|nr:PREDICTED: G-protein coupled receptor 15 [Chaetura pelagica]